MRGWVKICGVTTVADAEMVVQAGADAIGINLWPRSPRYVEMNVAKEIARAVRAHVAIVTVTVNMQIAELEMVRKNLQPSWLQLHGDEPDSLVTYFAPRAYRAFGLATPADVERAKRVPGSWVCIDAKDEIRRGGTGRAPPVALARQVCEIRPTLLAGGLGPDNVAEAIGKLLPAGVDAASRLELAPGRKDRQRVVDFVQQARQAFAARSST